MRAIPGELEDAAIVDGATRIRFFLRILLPLSRPALITVGILAFVTSWNAYLLPLVVFSSQDYYTCRWPWPTSSPPTPRTPRGSTHSPPCP